MNERRHANLIRVIKRPLVSWGVVGTLMAATYVGTYCLGDSQASNGDQSTSTAGLETNTPALIDISLDPRDNSYFSGYASGRFDETTYTQNGVKFRLAMQVLEERNDTRSDDLQRLYEDLREQHNGVEYVADGEIFEPKTGDRYYIADASLKKPGIFLRVEASLEPSGNRFLYHGMQVEILTDPINVTGPDGKPQQMFGIRVVDSEAFIDTAIKAEVGAVGFVSKQWLGGRVDPQGN